MGSGMHREMILGGALTPEQVLVQGLSVGSTDLILWGQGEQKTLQQHP